MDWMTKGAITALSVALLLAVARTLGTRLAGLLAGLPTVTGPALVWLALDHGTRYATEAAIGSIAACALCAIFALAYERASRHSGALTALALAIGVSLAWTPSLPWLGGTLASALLIACIVSPAVQAALPSVRESRRPACARAELVITALASGAVTSIVALCASSVGPFWAGVLASPPLVAAAIAMNQHRTSGHAAACGFLRGYVSGLLGRAVFGATFALLIVPAGVVTATVASSIAGASLGIVAAATRRRATPLAVPVEWTPPPSSPRTLPY